MNRLLLLILSSLLIAWSPTNLFYGDLSGCTKDTSNLVMDESAMSTDNLLDLGANANGQSVSYGSPWTLYSLEFDFGAATSSCVYSVRIGPDKDLTSTYYEEWASVSAPDGGGIDEIISVDNDSYSASTTYYIGIIEVSGTCILKQDSTSPPYADGLWVAAGTVWAMGTDGSVRDSQINVYKCQ